MAQIIKILSIDGGGIRGIIPILVLEHMRSTLDNLGYKKPFYSLFDIIAGTSTGGLIASALSLSSTEFSSLKKSDTTPLNELLFMYEKFSKDIFSKKCFTSINQLFNPKYSAKPFEKILSSLFHSLTLKDLQTNFLVTSFNMYNMEPLFFKWRPAYSRNQSDLNFYLKDVCRATSAAPTYFPPAVVHPVPNNEKKYWLIDGGTFANNPALCAYIEGRKIYPNADQYLIVSLGTGYTNICYKKMDLKDWGILGWISPWNDVPILKSTMQGETASTMHMLHNLPSVNVYRFDILLENGAYALDQTSKNQIQKLKQKAEQMIQKNKKSLNLLCHHLVNNVSS